MQKVTCYNVEGQKYEVQTGDLAFRPSVYGIIIKDNKILLSTQWDGYDFPGGKIELGETIEAALRREVKEETGFDVKVGRLVTCKDAFFRSRSGSNFHSILIYFLCEIIGGDPSEQSLAEMEKNVVGLPEWIDLANISKTKFYNSGGSVEIINEALLR